MAKSKEPGEPTVQPPDDEPIGMQFREEPVEELELPASANLAALGGLAGAQDGKADDEDAELPEEFRGLTRKQIVERLAARKDEGAQVAEIVAKGLSELAGAIPKPQPKDDDDDEAQVGQKPGETLEAYFERVGDDLFNRENMAKLFPEAVMRSVAPALMQANASAMMLAQKVLRLDSETGPIYARYRDEIEREAKKLMKRHGPDARIYDVAYQEVTKRHQADIERERIEAAVQERLRAAGVDPEATKVAKQAREPPPVRPAGSSSLAAGGTGDRTIKIKITPELRRAAEAKGVTVERYVRALSHGED